MIGFTGGRRSENLVIRWSGGSLPHTGAVWYILLYVVVCFVEFDYSHIILTHAHVLQVISKLLTVYNTIKIVIKLEINKCQYLFATDTVFV